MRRIEILLFDGLDELDVVAPFEILVSAVIESTSSPWNPAVASTLRTD
jgi:hypothetical protein